MTTTKDQIYAIKLQLIEVRAHAAVALDQLKTIEEDLDDGEDEEPQPEQPRHCGARLGLGANDELHCDRPSGHDGRHHDLNNGKQWGKYE